MHDTLRALRALQELDQEIFRLNAELRRLPAERDQRRAGIDRAIATREDLDRRHLELRTRVKEIEDMTTQQRQRMRKVESEALSSRGDVALLAAYQHQIRTLKRDISAAEEEGLQLIEESEAGETELVRMKDEIDAAEKVFEEFSHNAEREIAEATSKRTALATERAARLTDDVDRESLTLYERLLAAREGVALAELEGRICQRCYMEVPSNLYVQVARGTALAQCPSCDRIFYIRRGDR